MKANYVKRWKKVFSHFLLGPNWANSQLVHLLLHTGCTPFYSYRDISKVRWRKVLKSFHQLEDLNEEEHFKSTAFNNSTNKYSKGTTTKKKFFLKTIDYGAIFKINIWNKKYLKEIFVSSPFCHRWQLPSGLNS